MPVPYALDVCVENPELKALERFIDQKHSQILGRFDDLLQQQQLVEQLVRTLTGATTWNPGAKMESQNGVELPRVVSDESVKRRNSYDMAKAESNLRRKPFYGEPKVETSQEDEKADANSAKKAWYLEIFFAVVIMSNAILLGIQTEWSSRNLTLDEPILFTVLQVLYALLFMIEIAWRISVSGWQAYLCSNDWAWHLLDILVTISAVIDIVATLGGFGTLMTPSSNSGFRLLRVMKIARLVRAIRIVKVLRFIRALRVLVFSIIHTMRSLVWSLVLLFVIMYSFGILFADAATDYILVNADAPSQLRDGLLRYFGTLLTSMNTLFRAISGGVTWEVPAELLLHVGPEWTFLFTFYVAFCCFAVLNVMTGVFCHSAISGAEKDQELVVQALMHERDAIKKTLQKLFQEVDDGSGRISLSEFEEHFADESMKTVFESLELGAADAWTLFQLLDSDGNNFIDVDEFVDSCIRHRGSAKSVDVCSLRHQLNKVRGQLSEVVAMQEQMQHQLLQAISRTFRC